MADPLSVAGLAAGLVSLGIQVYGGVAKYLDALDCRDQDIASIKQQNDSIHKAVHVIEASLAQLQSGHQGPTAVVRTCLDSCRTDLKALDDLVAQLTDSGPSTVGQRSRIRSHGKKLLYPFSRPKLEQLEKRLRNANKTLQLALQVLGISMSQSGAAKLASLESTSHSISANLLVVQSQVSAINTPLRGIHDTLSGLEARLENRFENLENLLAVATQLLAHKPVVGGNPQEITAEAAISRLLGKPGMLRDICDTAGLRPKPLPTSAVVSSTDGNAAHFRKTVSPCLGKDFSCLCGFRQRLRRKNAMWRSFAFFIETTADQHQGWCPAARITGVDRSRKISFAYTGLRGLLDSAVQISFAMRSGAGGWSLNPNFTYYPTVDAKNAPAFRMMNILFEASVCSYGAKGATESSLVRWEKLAGLVLTKILELFRTGKASPLAVDSLNQSLLHHLAVTIRASLHHPVAIRDGVVKPLIEILRYLVACKVSATDYDIHGRTPLSKLTFWRPYPYSASSLIAASDLILQTSGEHPPAVLCQDGFAIDRDTLWTYSTVTGLLNILTASPGIAEAYGCGPLSLAILANDQSRVEYLVEHHPATLNERNLLGQSPLHLAVDKPAILRLIAPVADDRLLNGTSNATGISPLEAALSLSGSRCREGWSRRRCRRCHCAEPLVILIKAGCALPLPGGTNLLQSVLSKLSQRCRLRYIRALRDRRDRLKQLALDNFSAVEAKRLGLLSEAVLDFQALRVAQILQQRGVRIPEALRVTMMPLPPRTSTDISFFSVYRHLRNPLDAELFFRLGFRPISCGLKTAVRNASDVYWFSGLPLPYIEWLDGHGVDVLFLRFWSFEDGSGVFAAHLTCLNIGSRLLRGEVSPIEAAQRWIQRWHVALLQPDLVDSCRCKCSTGGCTPPTYLLKGMTRGALNTLKATERSVRDVCRFLGLFGAYLDVRHCMASLRFLTFMALGIPHTCCRPQEPWQRRRYCPCPPGEAGEIEDEYSQPLTLLEALLEEFEREVAGILQNNEPAQRRAALVNFWKRTWLTRVWGVRQHLDGCDLSDAERRGAEDIGVVWDRPTRPSPEVVENRNPYDKVTLDYWFYELEQIDTETH